MSKEKYVESGKMAQDWVNAQVWDRIASKGGITAADEEHIICEVMRKWQLSEAHAAQMIVTAFALSKEQEQG